MSSILKGLQTEGYRAGATGGAGLGIEKSPIEKIIEKPLEVDEHINSPGGMGQSYRKFTPKTEEITERYDEWDEADTWYIFDYASGKLKQTSFKHAQEREARNSGYSQSIEQALRRANIIRSKFNPKKFVQKQDSKWVEVFPFGKKEMSEEQIPMFTPEEKMVNANDPRSDGWRVYKAQPSGMLEGILQEYDTKTIDQVIERLPKGLTVDNFAMPAFKEYLYQKYYAVERPNWKELSGPFAQEYRQKHGIKEYKLGDLNYFDDMLVVLPKGLSPEQLNVQGFKEFIYQKHGSKEWPDFKKNRYTYWDAYQKAGGAQKPGFFSKMKTKMGLDEADTALPLDMAYSQARQITKMIKYDDTVNDIIVKITMLAEKAGISENEFKYAIDDVYAAHRQLESAVYGLDEVFKEKLDQRQNQDDDIDEGIHIESSIMKGIQGEAKVDEYRDADSQRVIKFSKENPPDIHYLYQQFVQRMLSPDNQIDPKDWISKVNDHYGLSYTWKDYQRKGHDDHTNNWQKIINRYIVKNNNIDEGSWDNIKKGLGAAALAGTLAVSPSISSASTNQNQNISGQEIRQDNKIIQIKRPDKEIEGIEQGLGGATIDQLKKNIEIMHKVRPKEIGEKIGEVKFVEASPSMFSKFGSASAGVTHMVKIDYSNGTMLLPLIRGKPYWVMVPPGLIYEIGKKSNSDFTLDFK